MFGDHLFPDHPAPAAAPLRLGSLCTGYGGLDLAVRAVLGAELVFTADPDRNITAVLAARFPGVLNLGDITAVDFTALAQRAPVDVLTAGFPCQDISALGQRAGIEKGTRSGLWFDVARAVRALRPRLLVVENVAALRYPGRGLDVVLGQLATAGYDAWWRCLRAADVGAPHRRERLFLLARPRADLSNSGGGAGLEPAGRGVSAAFIGGWGVVADAHCRRHPAGQGTWRPASSRTTTSARGRGEHDRGLSGPLGIPEIATTPAVIRPADCHPHHRPGDHRDDDHRDDGGEGCAHGCGLDVEVFATAARVEWGDYRDAVERWARVLGRAAPPPVGRARSGGVRLSPAFVEWLMGLPPGWVTDVAGLSWTAQIHALGNGVVPLQAEIALRLLLHDAGLCSGAGTAGAGSAAVAGRWAA